MFVKNKFRFWDEQAPFCEKQAPCFGKTGSVFGANGFRVWEKQVPFLGQTGSVLGKQAPFLGQTGFRFWGNTCAFFGKNRLRFWDKQVRFGGNWLGFWIGLGQSSSLTALNAKHVWVWIFEVLGLGVTENKSTGGKLEGQNAQTYKLGRRNYFGVCVRDLYEMPQAQTDIQSSY